MSFMKIAMKYCNRMLFFQMKGHARLLFERTANAFAQVPNLKHIRLARDLSLVVNNITMNSESEMLVSFYTL